MQHDDPSAHLTCPFPFITGREVWRCLDGTNNLPAPGESGISWEILKMAWPVIEDHFITLATPAPPSDRVVQGPCGYHTQAWKGWIQPGQKLQTSLLETLSQLMEKVMSKVVSLDIDKCSLILHHSIWHESLLMHNGCRDITSTQCGTSDEHG